MRICRLLIVVSVLIWIQGCNNGPSKPQPQNQSPVIQSLTAFPTIIGAGDSTIVICQAVDPDDDQLTYTWVTDSRLVIKGKQPNEHVLFSSPSNTQVFYYGMPTAFDTAWVECDVLDPKGGNAVREVTIHLVNQ